MNFRYDPIEEKLIVSQATRVEYHQISIWLERFVKGYRFMQPFKMGIWSGKKSYFDNGKVNLGLWKECFKACKEIDVTFNIENRDEFPINREVTLEKVQEFCKEFFKHHKIKDKSGSWVDFTPYDYQIETAYKILKNRYCMAEVATSGGKSLIISIVHFYTLQHINPDAKLLVIVPSISLVTQFYDNLIEYNYGSNFSDKLNINTGQIDGEVPQDYKPCEIRIEEIMSDKPRKFSGVKDPNIYVGCYQSLEGWPKEFFKDFHSVVVDEAHTCKATTLKNILERTFTHAYNRYGVSGTFPVDDSLEILAVQSVLGPKVSQIEASTLVKSGTITPMTIKVIILNHNNPELNDRLKFVRKQGAGKEAFQYEKEIVHQSDKRLEFIKKIVDKCDKNTLLLFHTIEYGMKIFEKLKSEISDKDFFYIDGEVTGKNREAIKKEMEKSDGKIKVLIASYGTMSVGVSIKNLHYLIMADSFKSEQIVIQAIGRLLRLVSGKKMAVIFDISDVFSEEMNNILYGHYIERRKFYDKRKYPYKEIKIRL